MESYCLRCKKYTKNISYIYKNGLDKAQAFNMIWLMEILKIWEKEP